MKNSLRLFTVLIIVFFMTLSSTAFAATQMEDLHSAKDVDEMVSAMRMVPDLADEVALLDGIKSTDIKDRLLSSLFRRVSHYDDIAGFKAMFATQYEKKTTIMNWHQGYPYISTVSGNGAQLVVKSDTDGWVYIVSFADNVVGGLSDEYSFMKFYNADNGAYKTKVWVRAGRETTIPIASASWGNGDTYRIYYCLKTGGNESGFGLAKYAMPKFWYNLEMVRSELLYDTDGPEGYENYYYYDYYFYLTSSHELYYEALHLVTGYGIDYYDDYYRRTGQTVEIDYEFTTDFEVENEVWTRVTDPGGTIHYDEFILPGPDS